MRVLIVGGSGSFGRQQARTLARHGYQVALLDRALLPQECYPEGVTLHTGDWYDLHRLHTRCTGLDAIVHAGGFADDVTGTRMLLAAAHAAGVARVVYLSSAVVYGAQPPSPIPEAAPLAGSGCAVASIHASEQVCTQYRRVGMSITILRTQPWVDPGGGGVFHLLFTRVQRGKRIPIIGTGNRRYQLLDIEDLTSAVHLALNAPVPVANDTFNVGARRFGMISQDLRALCDYAGNGARVLPVPARPARLLFQLLSALQLAPVPAWVLATAERDVAVATAKIECALGWEPRYSNAEALIRAYQWYLDQRSIHRQYG